MLSTAHLWSGQDLQIYTCISIQVYSALDDHGGRMTEVNALLDRLKQQQALPSEYALAKLLHVTQENVRIWRSGRSAPDTAILVRIAELLNQEPLPLMATVEIEREQHKKKPRPWAIDMWKRYAPRLRRLFLRSRAPLKKV